MELILLRHGNRNHFADGLDEFGLRQAKNLVELTTSGQLPLPDAIFCSPKKRTQQTTHPLSQVRAVPMTVACEIDERHENSNEDWLSRIDQFIEKLDQFAEQRKVVLCSHIDWIETFLHRLPTDLRDIPIFSTGEWMHLRKSSEIFELLSTGRLE